MKTVFKRHVLPQWLRRLKWRVICFLFPSEENDFQRRVETTTIADFSHEFQDLEEKIAAGEETPGKKSFYVECATYSRDESDGTYKRDGSYKAPAIETAKDAGQQPD